MHACTIVARNYLAQAQVLVDSFRKHHPDGTIDVLLIEDPATERPQVDGAGVLMIDEIGIAPGVLERMTVAYEIIEIATAVKPWLLRSLLDRGFDHAVYFDPDISIERPISELPGLCREHSIVLTPHLTEPMPRDGGLPAEQNLLVSGTYNLGFIGVGDTEQGRRMLDWWSTRLATDSYVDVEHGFFTDQRFIDFVPSLFEPYLVKDPSWNVAYWNLATRPLTRGADGGVLVAGHPLTFVHLSGYSPRLPHLLSKHQGSKPRLRLSEDEVLRDICDDYGARLRAAGFESAQTDFVAPFTRHDGVGIDRIVRHLVRREIRAEAWGKGTGLGWSDTEGQSLAEWLADPIGDETTYPNLGRYLTEVFLQRPDLQMTYPEVGTGDISGYLSWLRHFGGAEMGVPRKVIRTTRQHWDARRPGGSATEDLSLVPGIEVVGYLNVDAGLGEVARQFVASLEHAGIPLSTTTYDRTPSRKGAPWTDRPAPAGARYDTALVCVNADMLPVFARDVGADFFSDRYVIGLWFWELPDFPPKVAEDAFAWLDEVWVCSEFNAKALRSHTDKPITVVPMPVHAPQESHVLPSELEGDDAFTFLFVYDELSVQERKNPVGLIEAFDRAFPTPGEARLVIKTINGSKAPTAQEKLRYHASRRPDVHLLERYLLREELDGLMWNADCYVSLHRSEGFGLTIAETMAIGKPVIATNWSGNMTFMSHDNSLLVGHVKVAVGPDNDPYPPDSRWAAPKLDQATDADADRLRGRGAASPARRGGGPDDRRPALDGGAGRRGAATAGRGSGAARQAVDDPDRGRVLAPPAPGRTEERAPPSVGDVSRRCRRPGTPTPRPRTPGCRSRRTARWRRRPPAGPASPTP